MPQASVEADLEMLKGCLHYNAMSVVRTACACVRSTCLSMLLHEDIDKTLTLGMSDESVAAMVKRYQAEEDADPFGELLWCRLASRPEFVRLHTMQTTAKAASRSDAEQEGAAESYIKALKEELSLVSECRYVYQLDEMCLQWLRMDERFMTIAETRRRMGEVKLGGSRESITMLPIVNCLGTRCIIWVATSAKAADNARKYVASGAPLPGTVSEAHAAEPVSGHTARLLAAEAGASAPPAGPRTRSAPVVSEPTSFVVPAEEADDFAVEPTDEGDSAETVASDLAEDGGATSVAASSSSASSVATSAPEPASSGRRRRSAGKSCRLAAVMSAKHLPGKATVTAMDKDGILHLFFGSSNGWVTKTIFHEAMQRWTTWEAKQDPKWAAEPKLLLMDGHPAHTDTESIRHLQGVNTRCLMPPGASSHMWQVLDNGPFGAFRKEFASIRVAASGANATGVVPCPATVIGIRKGYRSKAVFADLSVEMPDGEQQSICVRLTTARKAEVHPSDTLCAGYYAWMAVSTPEILGGGFVHTSTFAKGFTPLSKPVCDPAKIMARLEAHRGAVDAEQVNQAAHDKAQASLPLAGVELSPAQLAKMRREIDTLRDATNYGLADDVDGPNKAKRAALDRDNRMLVARTTDDLLKAVARFEREERKLQLAEADADRLTTARDAAELKSQLPKHLAKARATITSVRATMKAVVSTSEELQAGTGLTLLDSAWGSAPTPSKPDLKRIYNLSLPEADVRINQVRFMRRALIMTVSGMTSAAVDAPDPGAPTEGVAPAETAIPEPAPASGAPAATHAPARSSKRSRTASARARAAAGSV